MNKLKFTIRVNWDDHLIKMAMEGEHNLYRNGDKLILVDKESSQGVAYFHGMRFVCPAEDMKSRPDGRGIANDVTAVIEIDNPMELAIDMEQYENRRNYLRAIEDEGIFNYRLGFDGNLTIAKKSSARYFSKDTMEGLGVSYPLPNHLVINNGHGLIHIEKQENQHTSPMDISRGRVYILKRLSHRRGKSMIGERYHSGQLSKLDVEILFTEITTACYRNNGWDHPSFFRNSMSYNVDKHCLAISKIFGK